MAVSYRCVLALCFIVAAIGLILTIPIGPVDASPEGALHAPIAIATATPAVEQTVSGAEHGEADTEGFLLDGGMKPMLAQANLPAVEQVLELVKAAPAPLWSLKSPSARDAPTTALAALESARTALSESRDRDAASILIPLYDQYRGTQAISDANRVLMDKGEEMVRQNAARGAFEEFESGFPSWETLGAGGKYAITDYYKEVFYVAQQEDKEKLAAPYRQKALEFTRRLVFEHPDDPLQNSAVGTYYDYGVEEGGQALLDVIADLEVLAARPQANMNRLGARYNLASYAQNVTNDRGTYILRMSEVVEDFDAGFVDAVFDDPDVIYWVKSWLLLSVGQALRAVGRYEDALDVYTEFDEWILGRAGGGIRLEMADLVKILSPQDAFAQAKAYEGIVASMDKTNRLEGEFRARALQKLGAVYMNYGDYRGAAQILEQLTKEHPEDKIIPSVEQDLNFIYAHLHNSMEVYNFAPADPAVYAQVCGPRALQQWLALRGTYTAIETLAVEARNDQHGASMFGLMEAAARHGLDVVGVSADTVEQLPLPFLAHVDEEHFLLVVSREGMLLSISDNGGAPEPMPMGAFTARWNGKALIEQRSGESLAELTVLDLDTLKGARGGTGSSNDNNAPPPAPPGKRIKPYSSLPSSGQQSIVEAYNPWTGDTRYVPQTGLPGAPDTATGGIAYSGVFVPGGVLSIIPSGATLQLTVSDLRVPVRGDLQLAFTRQYLCKAGFATTEYTSTSKPWSNNIGKGWTHNLNIHLKTTTPTGSGYPLTVTVYDETGEVRTFVRSSAASTGTEDIYYRSLAVYPEEKRQVLVRNKAAGTYVLWLPENSRYEFSAPTTTTDRFARLERIADAHGNELTMEYDGAVGAGKLVKAHAPSGDPRYLQFTYTGSLITYVALMNDTTELAGYSYTHDVDDELVEVEDSGENSVTYTYGTHGSVPASRYLTQITDKNAVPTDISWAFTDISGTGYTAYLIAIDTDDGRSTVYQRSLSTYIASAITYDGTTPLSKYVYTPVGATGMPWHVDYYESGSATTFERWTYVYSTDGYSLEQIIGPGSVVLADYTRDGVGRPTATTDVTGYGPAFSYSSNDDALPSTITRRDGTSVALTFDANDRIENVLETGVISGTTYEYDSYGQIVTVTDPLGNDTNYTYDTMGNLIEYALPGGDTVTRIFNDFGNVLYEYDGSGAVTQYEYGDGTCQQCGGAMGLLTKKIDALWNITEYAYDANGNRVREIMPDGSENTFTYNARGKLTSRGGPSGPTSYSYDLLGRMTSMIDAFGRTTACTYDHMGRRLTRDDGLTELPYTYDSYGNLISETTANGNDIDYVYDATMRKTADTDEIGTTTYDYNNLKDILIGRTDPLNNTTTFEYDAANRLVNEVNGAGREKHYTYDDYGRKVGAAAGIGGDSDPIEHVYNDTTGRLITTSYTNGTTETAVGLAYDSKGRTTQITDWIDPTHGLRISYDILGRVSQVRDHYGASLRYSYDNMGRVTQFRDYFGNNIDYEYDAAHGHVSRIEAPGGKVWTFAYDSLGLLERVNAPNGMSTTYQYDGAGRVTEITHANGVAVNERFRYAYNASGAVVSESRLDGTRWAYEYDVRGRLTEAVRTLPDGEVFATYTSAYDAADNLLSYTIGDSNGALSSQSFSYESDNRLASLAVNGGTPVVFTYDDWGRLTEKSNGTLQATYAYDAGTEASAVESDFPGEVDVTYSHRGDAKLRRIDVPNEISFYHWALGDYPVGMEILPNATALKGSPNASIRRSFVPLNPLASSTTILGAIDASDPEGGEAAYYLHDLNGSVRAAYDGSAARAAGSEFTPFGADVEKWGDDLAFGFRGALYEANTGKSYRPSQSRAINTEPAGAASFVAAIRPSTPDSLAYEMEVEDRVLRQQACESMFVDCLRCDEFHGARGGSGMCNREGGCYIFLDCFSYRQQDYLPLFRACNFSLNQCLSEIDADFIDQGSASSYTPFFTVQQHEKTGDSPERYRITALDRTYVFGNDVNYNWYVDTQSTDYGLGNPEFELTVGSHTIMMQLTVIASGTFAVTLEKTVSIYVAPLPVAAFAITTDLTDPTFPVEVEFQNQSSNVGTVSKYRWNFGDGAHEEITDPYSLGTSHAYAQPGNYRVTLTVVSHNGSDTVSHPVEFVLDPIPRFTWSQVDFAGGITLHDTTIPGNAPVEVREWDFDDDGIFDSTAFSTNSVVTQTFSGANIDHPVTLRVGTEAEATAGTLHSVTLPVRFNGHVIPDFTAVVTDELATGEIRVLFTESSNINSADPVVLTGWSWDFGDESVEPDGSPLEYHDYSAPGDFPVTLKVSDGTNDYAVTKTVHAFADDSYPEYGEVDDFQSYSPGEFHPEDWVVEGSGEWSRDGIALGQDENENRYLTVNAATPPNLTNVAIVQRPQRAPNNRLNAALQFHRDPAWGEEYVLDDTICAAFRTRAANEAIYSVVELYPNKVVMRERWGNFGTDDFEAVEFPLETPLALDTWYNVYIETYGHLRQVWIRSEGEAGGAKGVYDWEGATAGPPQAWRSQDKLEERDPPATPLTMSALTSIHIVFRDAAGNYYPDAVRIDDYGLDARTGDFIVPFLEEPVVALARKSIGKPEGDIYAADLAVAPPYLNWAHDAGAPITSLRGLEYFRTTTRFDAPGHAIVHPFPLTQPAGLSHVVLAENAIETLLRIDYWDTLRVLDLSGNPLSTPGALDGAAALTGLEEIYLRETGLHDVLFGDMGAAAENATENVALNGLMSLPNLGLVDLRCTQVRNLYPLVRNLDLAEGDAVLVSEEHFPGTAPPGSIPRLEERGVAVTVDPAACPDLATRYRIRSTMSAPGKVALPPDHGCTVDLDPAPDSCGSTDTTYQCIEAGETVTVTPEPAPGFLVTGLKVNGAPVELVNGACTFEMDGDKDIAAEFTSETILTLNFPTPDFTPEVHVDNGFILTDTGTQRTIGVATGQTVTLTIPDNALVNFDEGLAFSHWAATGQPFDGSRAETLEIAMTEGLAVEVVGTAGYHWLEVRDHFDRPAPGQPETRRGTATFSTDPPDAVLALSIPDTEGTSTRYVVLDGAEVSLAPAPEADYAFDHWEYFGAANNPATSGDNPFTLTMDQNWTVEPRFGADPHVLTVNIDPEGAGQVAFTPDPINGEASAGQRVEYFNPFRADKSVTLRAVEDLDSDRRFDHWEGGAIHGLTDCEVTFELTGDAEVSAVFIPSFALSIRNLGGGAVTLDPPGRTTDAPRDYEFYPDPAFDPNVTAPVEVTVTAEQLESVHLDHWIVDGVREDNTAPLTLTMGAPHDVTAVFLPGGTAFQFSAQMQGEGTVHLAHSTGHESMDRDLTASDGTFTEKLPGGATVTATQTPATGWLFDHWRVSDVGGVSVETGTLPAIAGETDLVAVFREDTTDEQVTLTLTQSGEGNVVPAPGITCYDSGSELTFSVEPARGWAFVGWTGGFASTEPTYTHTITENLSVHATFAPDGVWYSLDVIAGDGGSVSPAYGYHQAGTPVTITATADEGWVFDHWEGDGLDGSVEPVAELSISANTLLRAYFVPLIHIEIPNVDIMPGGTFTISPYKPEGYRLGEVIRFTPTPDTGWEFDHWEGDVTDGLGTQPASKGLKQLPGSPGEVTTTIHTAPYVLWAVFRPETYRLTTRAVGGGTIHKSPHKLRYRPGERVKLVAIPDENMVFGEWIGEVQEPTSRVLEFEMPWEDIEFTALFRSSSRTYTITVLGWMHDDLGTWIISQGDLISMHPPLSVFPAGSRVTLAAGGRDGFEFSHWTGDIDGTNSVHTIQNMSRDLVVAPAYRRQTGASALDSKVTVSLLHSSSSPPPIGMAESDPPATSVETSTHSTWHAGYEDTCSANNRITSWTLRYPSPMPAVTITVPGAKSILFNNTILGSNSVTLEPLPNLDCIEGVSGRHLSLFAYDVSVLDGRVDRLTYQCLSSGGGADCDAEGLCLHPDVFHSDPNPDLELFNDNLISGIYMEGTIEIIGGPGYMYPADSGGFVFSEGEFTSIGWAPIGNDDELSEFDLQLELGWNLLEDNTTIVDGNVHYEFVVSRTGATNSISTTVTPPASGNVVNVGSQPEDLPVTLLAQALPGYDFSHWVIPLLPQYPGADVVEVRAIPNPLELSPCYLSENDLGVVTAVFEANCDSEYPIDVTVVGEGSVSITERRTLYDCDDSVELLAVPDLGHTFAGWDDDLLGSVNPKMIQTYRPWNVTAIFEAEPDPGFVVRIDADGNGTPDPNPVTTIQLVNVPASHVAINPPSYFESFAKRIEFSLDGTESTQDVIQDDLWEVTIEQDSDPNLQFFATNAWVAYGDDGNGQYPEISPGVRPVTASSFDLRDLYGLGVYVVAYDIPELLIPHEVSAKFNLYKNGVLRTERTVHFQVVSGAFEVAALVADTENSPGYAEGANTGDTTSEAGKAENGQAGDPVNLFSGEFVEEMTDLAVASPGFNFEWSRIYRSKHARNNTGVKIFTGPAEIVQEQLRNIAAQRNPAGEQWDFSYNIWVKRQNDGKKILVHDGRSGREEIWEREGDSGPWTNGDYPTQITCAGDSSPVYMTYADQTVYEFYPLHESAGGKRGRLRNIRDRFDNVMWFDYREREDGTARLWRIRDTAGRAYHLYYDSGHRIKRVRDFTGRSVYYAYDGEGRLVRVRDSHGTTVNRYEYLGDSDLLAYIWDGKGQNYLTNEYDTSSTDFMKHRVTRQVYGEGVFNFSYEFLGTSNATWRVTVNDGEGNVSVTVFDDKNRMRSERVYAVARENADEATTYAMVDGGAYFETSYQYQGDTSLVTRIDYPRGDYETFTYGGTGWYAAGNMRTASYHPAGGGTPITQAWDYFDGFGNHGNHSRFVARYQDGRGNESLTSHTTEGNPLTRTYAISGITESFTYNSAGQMTSHTHPAGETGPPRVDTYGYRSDGYLVQQVVDAGGLNLTTTYVPNARGLAKFLTDPNGNTAERNYDHRDRLVWERTPTVTGTVNRARESAFVYDRNNNLRYAYTENFDEEGTDDSNEVIVREIRYNTLNSPTDILEEVEEGVFIHTHTDYDRNENVVKQWSGEAVAGNEPLNKATFVYNTRQLVEEEYRGDPATQDDTLTIQYTYDENGNAREVTQEPSGAEPDRITYNQYDGFNRLQYVTDPMGNVTEFAYDENGNLTNTILWGEVDEDTATVPADGEETTLDTHRGTLTRMAETTSIFDELNRRTHTQVAYFDLASPAGFPSTLSTVETKYNLNSTVERVINPNGHATEYDYDSAYRLTGTTDAKGNQITLDLDDNGNVERTTETATTDVPGHSGAVYFVDVTYDELNRPIQTENNAGHITVTKYDSRGNVVYAKDAEDNVSRFEYDGLNRLLKTTRITPEYPADVVTEQGWDDNSRLLWQEDPNGNVTTHVYDALDRLDKVVFADATEVDYTYDSFGNVKHKLDANLTAIASTYDALNRLTGKTITPDDPQGSIQGATFETYQYDSLSNTTVAANDFATVMRTFDSMSNLRSETVEYASDSFTRTISHTYDLMGNPDTTTYPGGRTVTHSYDDLERIATIHSSQGGEASTNLLAAYDYLGAGRVERRTTAGNGTQLDYEFDAIGRVNATVHSITATSAIFDDRSYIWDKANNKTHRVEFVGSTPVKTYDYQYDSLNRLVRSTKTIGAVAPGTAGNWTGAMTLDSATPDLATFQGGTPLQLDGVFSATFDPGTLQVFVTQTQGTRDEAEDYVAELEGYTGTQIDVLAPAMPEQGTFDLYVSALDGATRVYSNPVPIIYGPHIVEYDLDGAGNRDALYTQYESAPGTFTDLDSAAYTEDATAPIPADAQMNQYTTAPGDTSARVYDENGNLLVTDEAAYRHDYRDRISDRDDGTTYAAYVYDALGRRIEKTVDDGTTSTTTRYLHDGARVAEEWDVPTAGSPTLSASYVYGLYIDEVLTMRRGATDYYYHADDMHNVVKLTDNTGAVLEAYDYSDYGLPEFFDAAGNGLAGTAYANPYLFTGRRWDAELGYYYYRNRYMDPAQGRFASRDPLGLWGDPLNLGNGYTYAGSNPWSLVDPYGLAAGGNIVERLISWAGEKIMAWVDKDRPSVSDLSDQFEGNVDYNAINYPEHLSAAEILSAESAYGRSKSAEDARELGIEVAKETAPDMIGGGVVAGLAKVGKKANDARKAVKPSTWQRMKDWFGGFWNRKDGGPNPKTGTGYGVNDPPVRIEGEWSDADLTTALYGRPPKGLGSPDLHHADQMPGSGIHEIVPSQHRTNPALHQNRYNQGVTPEMRANDRQLHWWYRAREQGADQRLPDLIYDD